MVICIKSYKLKRLLAMGFTLADIAEMQEALKQLKTKRIGQDAQYN